MPRTRGRPVPRPTSNAYVPLLTFAKKRVGRAEIDADDGPSVTTEFARIGSPKSSRLTNDHVCREA